MTSTPSNRVHTRATWLVVVGTAALSTLTVTAAATSTGASGESSTSESPTSDDSTSSSVDESSSTDASSTTAGDSTSSTEASTSSAPAGSTAPSSSSAPADTMPSMGSADFTAMLATECEGDPGQPLLADALQTAVGTDGSIRIVEILRTCDVEFVGAVDETLGRPTTNVEALIADPANNVTPNQAQTDLLDAELSVYWRIADAWAQSQQPATGVTTTTAVDASPTTATEASAPGSEAPTSGPEDTPTTGG